MSRIPDAFGRRKALIPYVTVGYPRPETALELVPRLEGRGDKDIGIVAEYLGL